MFLFSFIFSEITPAKIAIVEKMMSETNIKSNPKT